MLKEKKNLGPRARFAQVVLHEPAKEVVLSFTAGDPINREAFVIILDNETEKTYEAIVSITNENVVSWDYIPDVQTGFMLDEFDECERVVKKQSPISASPA
ncbi:hypothetical protein QS257_18075 [Terrilactibacillus sp. S3-3]|nr:hypothetical protein QS257_18075 [Terrilactibacillus sp. S3-3]